MNRYGFTRWDPPDAGANQEACQEGGGGVHDNDGRFINAQGTPEAGTEGAVQYLGSTAAQQQPFCMFVSLVNPHDVLFYPKTYASAGYDDSWLQGELEPPETANERLVDQADRAAAVPADLSTPPARSRRRQMKRDYLNFYGNLMKASDAYLVKILETLGTARPARAHARHRARPTTARWGRRTAACGRRTSTPTRSRSACRSCTRTQPVPEAPASARSSRTSISCRRWQVSSARRPALAPTGRGSTTRSSPRADAPRPSQDYTVFTYDD